MKPNCHQNQQNSSHLQDSIKCFSVSGYKLRGFVIAAAAFCCFPHHLAALCIWRLFRTIKEYKNSCKICLTRRELVMNRADLRNFYADLLLRSRDAKLKSVDWVASGEWALRQFVHGSIVLLVQLKAFSNQKKFEYRPQLLHKSYEQLHRHFSRERKKSFRRQKLTSLNIVSNSLPNDYDNNKSL